MRGHVPTLNLLILNTVFKHFSHRLIYIEFIKHYCELNCVFFIVDIPVCLKTSTARCLCMPLKEMPLSKYLFFLPQDLAVIVLQDISSLSYSCTFTWFCLLRCIQKREFYFYFIAFCARVLLAALDRNMHSFRPQATTKTGHLIFKKQYSKRTISMGTLNPLGLKKPITTSSSWWPAS